MATKKTSKKKTTKKVESKVETEVKKADEALKAKEEAIAEKEKTFQEMATDSSQGRVNKILNNTNEAQAAEQVTDIEFFGLKDAWKLICKASSKSEGWMKSTKAMQVGTKGCLVQVTTQQGENVAEALHFVLGAVLVEHTAPDGRKFWVLK